MLRHFDSVGFEKGHGGCLITFVLLNDKTALAQKGLFTAFFIFAPVSPSEGRHEEKKE
jgi:hypothetical protein